MQILYRIRQRKDLRICFGSVRGGSFWKGWPGSQVRVQKTLGIFKEKCSESPDLNLAPCWTQGEALLVSPAAGTLCGPFMLMASKVRSAGL